MQRAATLTKTSRTTSDDAMMLRRGKSAGTLRSDGPNAGDRPPRSRSGEDTDAMRRAPSTTGSGSSAVILDGSAGSSDSRHSSLRGGQLRSNPTRDRDRDREGRDGRDGRGSDKDSSRRSSRKASAGVAASSSSSSNTRSSGTELRRPGSGASTEHDSIAFGGALSTSLSKLTMSVEQAAASSERNFLSVPQTDAGSEPGSPASLQSSEDWRRESRGSGLQTQRGDGGSEQAMTEKEQMLFSLTPAQRVELFQRYVEENPARQADLDDLLCEYVSGDWATLMNFKIEFEQAQRKNRTRGNSSTKKLPSSNAEMVEDCRRFWFQTSANREMDERQSALAETLASYVPRLVVRRLWNRDALDMPDIESYPACVMFADISGFTSLAERLASQGLEGVEKLTVELNGYFDKLINIVYLFAGDIIKFAGDALLIIWPSASIAALPGQILLACQCAKALLTALNNYVVKGTDCTLRLHIGIGAGEVSGIHVGGVHNQLEFFIAGQVLEQVSACEKQASPGECFVSHVAWTLVEEGRLAGVQAAPAAGAHTATTPQEPSGIFRAQKAKTSAAASGQPSGHTGNAPEGVKPNWRLDSIEFPVEPPKVSLLPVYEDMEEQLKMFVQPAVLRHIDSGKRWLAELRHVSVIFVNLTAPFKPSMRAAQELQETITLMQGIIYKYEGTVRQFLIDDKGSVMIAGFGLPGTSHEDDPFRAVLTAVEIVTQLAAISVPCAAGVTTGKAFCGDVGSDNRREYAMVGDIVNLSARLMAAAKTGVLIDADTYDACKLSPSFHTLNFEALEPIRVKGKANPIPVYRPSTRELSIPQKSRMRSRRTIIGREEEFELLEKLVTMLAQRDTAGAQSSAQKDFKLFLSVPEYKSSLSASMGRFPSPGKLTASASPAPASEPRGSRQGSDAPRPPPPAAALLLQRNELFVSSFRASDKAELDAMYLKPPGRGGTPDVNKSDRTASSEASSTHGTPTSSSGAVPLLSPSAMAKQQQQQPGSPCTLLIIEGEAGVGKSIMMQQLELMVTEKQLKTFSATADQLDSTTPYRAWRDIFQTVLDDKKQVPESVVAEIGRELAPLLRAVLPHATNLAENEHTQFMPSQQRAETTQAAALRLLSLLVPPGSLISLDNANWLDSASWSLLQAACKSLDNVLFAVALRPLLSNVPFQLSRMRNSSKCVEMMLRNLPEEHTQQLMAQCLGLNASRIPKQVVALIHAKGNGNPFLTEEIVFALRESGKVQISPQGEIKSVQEIEESINFVPNSLQALLTSKVDRLSASQQICLKIASCIGQTFQVKMLLDLLPPSHDKSAAAIKADLDGLVAAGMIVQQSAEPELEYSFSNTLIKEVVYGLMLFSQRRQVHSSVVDYYNREFPGNATYYPLLAYHNKHAEKFEEAVQLYVQAGSACLNNYANKEAAAFLSEAIAINTKGNKHFGLEAIATERKVAQAYYNLGQFDRADEHFRKALELMAISIPIRDQKVKPPDKKKVAAWTFFQPAETFEKREVQHRKREAVISILALAKVNYFGCNKGIATFCAQLALLLAESAGNTYHCEAYAISSLTCGINGQHDVALLHVKKGQELAGKKQLDALKTLEQLLGMYYAGAASWTLARQNFAAAIDDGKTIGDLKSVEECQIFLGSVLFLEGELKNSIRVTKDALKSAQSRGDLQTQILALDAQARNYYVCGKARKCLIRLTDLRLALESTTKVEGTALGEVSAEINFNGLMSIVHVRMANYEKAYEYTEKAFSLLNKLEPTSYWSFVGYASLVESMIALSQRTPTQLQVLNTTKQKVLSKTKKTLALLAKFADVFPFAQPRLLCFRATLHFNSGKLSKADAEFTSAAELSAKLGMKYEQAFALHQRGHVFRSEPDNAKAAALFPPVQTRLDLYPQFQRKGQENQFLTRARTSMQLSQEFSE